MKRLPLFCFALAVLFGFLLRPVSASSLLDSRVNQLEFQVRSLQTQVSQLRSQSPSPARNTRRPAPVETPYIPGDPTLDQQFDNLATLVIELNQRVKALEARLGE